ncbi:MAG: hemolysin family protein [Rhizobiaceae bacterium]
MNERSSEPVSDETSQDTGRPITPNENLEARGRALMVIDREQNEGWFTRFMIRLGIRSGGTLRDDLNDALAGKGEAGDVFSPEERAMLQNILRLRERRVEDVMVPRAEIHAVGLDTSLADILREFEETGHSRLPVYGDTLDDPRGMVLIKDLLLYVTKVGKVAKNKVPKPARKVDKNTKTSKPTSKASWLDLSLVDLTSPLGKLNVIRNVLFVPPSMMASDLMARMQATRTQMALVIDEYGGTDGLVTLEDIVEEVVGEIEDEHDDDEADGQNVITEGDGIWSVDGRIELEKIIEEIGSSFHPGELAEDIDTLGGLVNVLAGRVPVRGEVVSGMKGYEFRVVDADPRRIKKLQVVQTGLREKRRKTAASKLTDKAS